MLFTDSDLISQAELESLDSEVTKIAAPNKIKLEGDGSIIRNTWDDCAGRLNAQFQSFTGYPVAGTTLGHSAAVLNTGRGATNRPRVRLSQVCTGRGEYPGYSPHILRWMQFHALYLVFRNAAHASKAGQYEKKMNLYEAESARFYGLLSATGLPVVFSPLIAPGAIHERNTGALNVSTVSGSGVVGGWKVAVTWTNGSIESAPSAIQSVQTDATTVLYVDISGLVPPSGVNMNYGVASGLTPYLAATGWNVYAGATTLYKQNVSPLPLTTTSFTFAGAPTTTGAAMGDGQPPDENIAFLNNRNIG